MMVDIVNFEQRLRYHAARRGYRVMRTRGLEHRRRKQCGIGTFVLRGQDGVALSAATLDDISEFLEAHERAQWRRLH